MAPEQHQGQRTDARSDSSRSASRCTSRSTGSAPTPAAPAPSCWCACSKATSARHPGTPRCRRGSGGCCCGAWRPKPEERWEDMDNAARGAVPQAQDESPRGGGRGRGSVDRDRGGGAGLARRGTGRSPVPGRGPEARRGLGRRGAHDRRGGIRRDAASLRRRCIRHDRALPRRLHDPLGADAHRGVPGHLRAQGAEPGPARSADDLPGAAAQGRRRADATARASRRGDGDRGGQRHDQPAPAHPVRGSGAGRQWRCAAVRGQGRAGRHGGRPHGAERARSMRWGGTKMRWRRPTRPATPRLRWTSRGDAPRPLRCSAGSSSTRAMPRAPSRSCSRRCGWPTPPARTSFVRGRGPTWSGRSASSRRAPTRWSPCVATRRPRWAEAAAARCCRPRCTRTSAASPATARVTPRRRFASTKKPWRSAASSSGPMRPRSLARSSISRSRAPTSASSKPPSATSRRPCGSSSTSTARPTRWWRRRSTAAGSWRSAAAPTSAPPRCCVRRSSSMRPPCPRTIPRWPAPCTIWARFCSNGVEDHTAALPQYRRAAKLRRARLGDEPHPSVANSLTGAGRALAGLGRTDEAIEVLEEGARDPRRDGEEGSARSTSRNRDRAGAGAPGQRSGAGPKAGAVGPGGVLGGRAAGCGARALDDLIDPPKK